MALTAPEVGESSLSQSPEKEEEEEDGTKYFHHRLFDVNNPPVMFFTWLRKESRKHHVYPQVRDQYTASSKITCAHHSLCPCIEVRNRVRVMDLLESSNEIIPFISEEFKNARVDVEFLIKASPPPSHPYEILDAVISKYAGRIPRERWTGPLPKDPFPFRVGSYDYINFKKHRTEEKTLQTLKKLCEKLRDGPVAAGFPISELEDKLKHGEVHVYDPTQPSYYVDDRTGKLEKLFHGVCLVGSGIGSINRKLDLFFQYLDSSRPFKPKNKRGVKHIIWSHLDGVIIPNIKVKKLKKVKKAKK